MSNFIQKYVTEKTLHIIWLFVIASLIIVGGLALYSMFVRPVISDVIILSSMFILVTIMYIVRKIEKVQTK